MKKYFYLAAVSAMMLTACSSDKDVLQPTPEPSTPTVAAQQQAVGFDVYVPAATAGTRSGLEGTMTTNRLQRSDAGFGVYAFLTEDANVDGGETGATAYVPTVPTGEGGKANVPNFMVNEKILWNNTNLGWYYNPLKYWPNETDQDSQTTPAYMENSTNPIHLDRLTFFAYAPYVSAGSATGITYITDKDGLLNTVKTSDPTIAWKATTNDATFNPNEGVDLLWGVAPSGGLSYTAVNGTTVTRNEGTPLLNMIKPDVNTSMKFLFQHALARFGINVVAAIDQVSPGGELDPNTKITIASLKITGPFGTGGELNLNNGTNKNIANWTKITGGTADEPVSGTTASLTANKSITVTSQIAQNLLYEGAHTFGSYTAQSHLGVTPAKQDLLAPSTKWYNKLAAAPVYNPGKKYYTDEGTTEAHAKLANGSKAKIDGKWGFFYTEAGGVYTKQAADDNTPNYPALPSAKFYFVKATEYTIATNATAPDGISGKVYTLSSGTYAAADEADAPVYLHNSDYSAGTWDAAQAGDKVYTLEAVQVPYTDLPYAYEPASESVKYYEAERNYLYVVPTNNVSKNAEAAGNEKALRTITVQIEYYITTEDAKINGGRTQTKNVITKEVVLPSLANGKSYMLNLVLGLTSVKIEAEVDDWKVENVYADLPQNTGN